MEDTGINGWIQNKNVSNYLLVKQSASNPLVATVECLQPFGAQVLVTVTALTPDGESEGALCRFDYLQRVDKFAVSFGDVKCNFGDKTNVVVQFNKNGPMKGGAPKEMLEYSDVYSLEDNFNVEYSLIPCAPILGYEMLEGVNPTSTECFVFGSGSFTKAMTLNDIKASLDYSTLSGYNAKNGLFFGAKFFLQNLGFASCNVNGMGGQAIPYTDDVDANTLANALSAGFERIKYYGDGATWNGMEDSHRPDEWHAFENHVEGLNLFTLHVKVTGKLSSFEKETTFRIGGYTVSLDSISLNQSGVIF